MISRFWLLGGLVLAVVLVGPARIGERLQAWMRDGSSTTPVTEPTTTQVGGVTWTRFPRPTDQVYALSFADQAGAYRWDLLVEGDNAHGVFSTASSSSVAIGTWHTSTTELSLTAISDQVEVAHASARWLGDTVHAEQGGTSPLAELFPQPIDDAVRVSYVRTQGRWEDTARGMGCVFEAVLPVVEPSGRVSVTVAEAINAELRRDLLEGRRNVEQAKDGFMRSCRTDLEAERAEWKDAGDPGGMFERSLSIHGMVLVRAYPELSILVDRSSYTGGAHGNGRRDGKLFDLETGRLIPFERALGVSAEELPEKMAGVAQTLLRRYDADGWLFEESAQSLRTFVGASSAERRRLWERGEAGFSSSTALIVMPRSISFVFQPYDIAPYAAGMIEVTMPRVTP